MKKITAMLLAAALVLGLTGCAGNQDREIHFSPKESTETAPVTESTEATEATRETGATEETETARETTEATEATETVRETEETKETVRETEETPIKTEAVTEEPSSQEPVNEFVNYQNTAWQEDKILINPAHVYWKDGKLIAECFVINGFSSSISNINVKSLKMTNGKKELAAAAFGCLEGLTLPPHTNVRWTFIFSEETVISYGADLSSIDTYCIYTYNTDSGHTEKNQIPAEYRKDVEEFKKCSEAEKELQTIRIGVGETRLVPAANIWVDSTVYSENTGIAEIIDGTAVRGAAPGETYLVAVSAMGLSQVYRIIVK